MDGTASPDRSSLADSACGPAASLVMPDTDWLRHDLVVTGPAPEVAAMRAAASGAGAIPWVYPDLEFAEEDHVLALVSPPDGSPGLRIAAARVLARQLRGAVEAHQQRVVAAALASSTCPFDLHALVPVPPDILRLGPGNAASVRWLTANWGTTRALRRVERLADNLDARFRRSARLHFEFWSADWTPWPVLLTVARRWPSLGLDIQPDYDDG